MAEPTVHGTFDEVVSQFPPGVQAIARALRAAITSANKDVVEVAWPRQKISSYGIGPKKMSEHYAYIAPQSDYVNLGFYHGVALNDPALLLEGAGKRLRHIKMTTASGVAREEIRDLLKEALMERNNAIKSPDTAARSRESRSL